jgi:hypothetical protein
MDLWIVAVILSSNTRDAHFSSSQILWPFFLVSDRRPIGRDLSRRPGHPTPPLLPQPPLSPLFHSAGFSKNVSSWPALLSLSIMIPLLVGVESMDLQFPLLLSASRHWFVWQGIIACRRAMAVLQQCPAIASHVQSNHPQDSRLRSDAQKREMNEFQVRDIRMPRIKSPYCVSATSAARTRRENINSIGL